MLRDKAGDGVRSRGRSGTGKGLGSTRGGKEKDRAKAPGWAGSRGEG